MKDDRGLIENLSEEIQQYLYENEIYFMNDNWIDDIDNVYEYMEENDISDFIFEKMYERIEYLYRLKYGGIANEDVLKNFFLTDEYKEVEENYQYYKKNEIKFKHGKLRSKGEIFLYNILMKEKVNFVFGESDGCKNDKTNKPLPFDFIIYHKGRKIYIEIQGKQHYEYNDYHYDNYKNFEDRLYKDKIKKEFAERNGIYVFLDYFNCDLKYLKKQIIKKVLPLIR